MSSPPRILKSRRQQEALLAGRERVCDIFYENRDIFQENTLE